MIERQWESISIVKFVLELKFSNSCIKSSLFKLTVFNDCIIILWYMLMEYRRQNVCCHDCITIFKTWVRMFLFVFNHMSFSFKQEFCIRQSKVAEQLMHIAIIEDQELDTRIFRRDISIENASCLYHIIWIENGFKILWNGWFSWVWCSVKHNTSLLWFRS